MVACVLQVWELVAFVLFSFILSANAQQPAAEGRMDRRKHYRISKIKYKL